MRFVYLHSEDLDGWLAPPNRPIPAPRLRFVRTLQSLRVECDGHHHELQIVLNSGKPPEYLEGQATRFGGAFVISGNGACWRRVGGATRRLCAPTPDFRILRALLGVRDDADGVATIRVPGGSAQVAFENKRDDDGDIVLSLFPEPGPVRHRWRFAGGIDRHRLYDHLRSLASAHGLAVHVAPPHPDGAVDVLPLLDGRPVGKWTLPHIARRLFPDAELRITHGGDGLNDLCALQSPDITPLTAGNCEHTATAVAERAGLVAPVDAPDGFPTRWCCAELARRGYYGPLSPYVAAVCDGNSAPITRSR